MRKLPLLWTAMFFAAVSQTPAQSDWIAQIHFAGAEQISADTNHLAFTNEFCSPAAQALESQTLNKLSRAPYAWFRSRLISTAGDGSARLRPLLDDFLKSEWFFQMRDTTNGSPEYALAIRLDPERAQLWSANLIEILQGWTGLPIAPDKSGNWQLRKHEPPNLLEFSRSGGWVVVDCGQNTLSLGQELLGKIASRQVKKPAQWFTLDLNWPRLEQLFPAFARFDLPKMQMQVVGTNLNFHVTGKWTLSQPLPVLPKWRFPTNLIHQPFYSFTAVRGFAPWLQKQSWAQPFLIQPMPDQLLTWALPQVPFQAYAAAPVPDADAALAALDRNLSNYPGWQIGLMVPVTKTATGGEITFSGVPWISPFVKAVREPAGNFLFAGFFPSMSKCQALPPDLIAHLNQPNLVYYNWEVTGPRLKGMPELSQLLLMATLHDQLDNDSAANKWLNAFGPKLGSTVSEFTQTAPNELTFNRRAPAGLTAVELTALASWLEAKNFPGCDLRTPAPRTRPGQKQFKVLSTPPATPAPAPASPH